jgi:hypothetical protein
VRRINQAKALFAFIVATTCAMSALAATQDRGVVIESEQNHLLSRRVPHGDTVGTFDSLASLLYAVNDIAIHTEDQTINAVALESAFADFYSPTLRELLNSIAWQTGSSWKYQAETGYWVFAKPAAGDPYTLIVPDTWTKNKRSTYVSYRPSNYPVGLDVYWLGSYSDPDSNKERELWTRVRNAAAVWFGSKFKSDVSVNDMRKTTVAGVDALYFESPTPRANVTWRQWAVVDGGRAFVIVSTLPNADGRLLSDVESMVKSFRTAP